MFSLTQRIRLVKLFFTFLLEFFSASWYFYSEVEKMTIGERLKMARKQAGLTQAQLAEKIGVPFQSISQWEHDSRTPNMESLNKLANALGCHVFWLFYGDLASVQDQATFMADSISEQMKLNPSVRSRLAAEYIIDIYMKKGYTFTRGELELITAFGLLNAKGKEKAIERVQELTEMRRYKAEKEGTQNAISEKEND